jgi:hypothetical protein
MNNVRRRRMLTRLFAFCAIATAITAGGCQPEGYGTIKAPPAEKSPFSPRGIAVKPAPRKQTAPKGQRPALDLRIRTVRLNANSR